MTNAGKDTGSDMKDEAHVRLAAVAKAWPLGIYRHYKRSDYILYSVSVNEATLEPMFHYYSLGHGTRWTRTFADFSSTVKAGEGHSVPRFSYAGSCTPEQLARAAGFAS